MAMSGAEVAGDLIDAALVAGVVEPHTDATLAGDGHTHETTCLNCGAKLAGPFCQECGQAAHVHRTLAAFFHDLLHGVFHFEGRIWHTLPLLALHPGQLTRRYIDGQRARFVSPLALFLFCVFLMFAVIQQTTHTNLIDVRQNGKEVTSRAALQADLTQLENQRRSLVARHADTDDVDGQIAGLRPALLALSVKNGSANASDLETLTTHIAWIDGIIARVRENPSLAAYKVEMHAYKYSWLLIPISVPFVWLLFPFDRRFPVYDHAVFVTYSLCFMTLLSVVVIIADSFNLEGAKSLLELIPPLHMYRQLRGTYGCSRIGALVRTVCLLVFAALALLIFVGVIVAQSAD
jgi:hypothetical protein